MRRILPNTISLSRILLSSIYFWVLVTNGPSLMPFFLATLVILSDGIDGFLARKWKVESSYGEFLDSFADSIFVIGSWIIFYTQGLFDLLLLIFLILPRILIGGTMLAHRAQKKHWNFTHTTWNRLGGAVHFLMILSFASGLPFAHDLLLPIIAISLTMAGWSILAKQLL